MLQKMGSVSVKKSNYRDETIDILRALGILLMVMGHIGFGGAFDKFIHAFHMPMFLLSPDISLG